MEIVHDYPPNYADIIKVFPQAINREVVFAYGDIIYNPLKVAIPPEIIIHENVHRLRQEEYGGADAWWQKYLTDLNFRLMEELLAHRAEYQALCERVPNRKMRRGCLKYVAKKLASPLYGGLISAKLAEKWLTENVEPAG